MTSSGEGHRSRLTALVIDVLADRYEESVMLWAEALGAETPRRPRPGQRYTTLKNAADGLTVLIQRVERDPGVHLDIETDSVTAEVARLESAGARRRRKVKSWWVLEDPSGIAFCVVRPQQRAELSKRRPWPRPPGNSPA
jgi:hypothetical protein